MTAIRSSRNTSTRQVNRVRGVFLRSARRSARDGRAERTDSSSSSLSPSAAMADIAVVKPARSSSLDRFRAR